MTDNTEMKGNWGKQKEKLKKKFTILTESDLWFDKDKKEEMLERLQVKLGKTKVELRKIIETL